MKIQKLTFPHKIFGLMFKKNLNPVYFETRFGLHTFFMKAPIDVFILNSKNVVVKIKKNLLPNSIMFWNPLFYRVIEAPTGLFKVSLGKKFTNL